MESAWKMRGGNAWILSALKCASTAGLRTAFDMDYRASSWPSAAEAGIQARKARPWVNVLLGNEDELSLPCGESEAGAQAQIGLHAGVSLVIRKRGSDGVEAYSCDGCRFAPKCPVKVVSTIGAGDGFAAGSCTDWFAASVWTSACATATPGPPSSSTESVAPMPCHA